MNNVGVIFMSTVTHHILRTREKGAKVPLGKGNEAMLNNCVSVHYTQDKKELFAARKRLLDALHGILVQFRSRDLDSAMRAMENTAEEVNAIKAHSEWLLDAINQTPLANMTNEASDATRHFRNCLQAV